MRRIAAIACSLLAGRRDDAAKARRRHFSRARTQGATPTRLYGRTNKSGNFLAY